MAGSDVKVLVISLNSLVETCHSKRSVTNVKRSSVSIISVYEVSSELDQKEAQTFSAKDVTDIILASTSERLSVVINGYEPLVSKQRFINEVGKGLPV